MTPLNRACANDIVAFLISRTDDKRCYSCSRPGRRSASLPVTILGMRRTVGDRLEVTQALRLFVTEPDIEGQQGFLASSARARAKPFGRKCMHGGEPSGLHCAQPRNSLTSSGQSRHRCTGEVGVKSVICRWRKGLPLRHPLFAAWVVGKAYPAEGAGAKGLLFSRYLDNKEVN